MPDRYRGGRYRDSSDRGEFGSRREGFRGGLGRLIIATQPIEVTLIQRPKPIATKIISAADG